MSESFVIIGDGIAGSSAAETLREEAPDADITVLTDEGEPLYNRILIKEFAKGKLPEAPVSIHEEGWYDERDVHLELNTYVTAVDEAAHEVHTHRGDTYEYDKLLVAAGGTPASLSGFGVDNADADGIHHFWTFQDARRIREHAERAEKGVVVGAGLLGIDFAAVCGAQGIDARYLMRGNRWWRYALSLSGAEIIHDGLRDLGVTPVFDSGVASFEVDDEDHVTAAVDPNGERYECDWAGVAIGLDFNVEFLEDTSLAADSSGIDVDEYMRTDGEDVYAAGDITRFIDTILGERTQNGSWGSAKEQGQVAARTMIADGRGEDPEEFRWVSSYSITHLDVPFLSFGHPTKGDEYVERTYSDTEWRRVALKDGRVVGGVLIGDLAPQRSLKQCIREQRDVGGQTDVLLAETIDLEEFAPAEQ